MKTGTVTVFLQHTSTSLIIFENVDHSARVDLEEYFERLVPEDGEGYTHTLEGPDDTTSHIRMGRSDTHRVNREAIHIFGGECGQGKDIGKHKR